MPGTGGDEAYRALQKKTARVQAMMHSGNTKTVYSTGVFAYALFCVMFGLTLFPVMDHVLAEFVVF